MFTVKIENIFIWIYLDGEYIGIINRMDDTITFVDRLHRTVFFKLTEFIKNLEY